MPDRQERVTLIEALQEERGGSHVISYVTSTRPQLEVQMAMDVVPIVFRHLQAIDQTPEETKIDLVLHSNGGESIVPWRLVTLIREFCSTFAVLVPHRAFSAATLLALGADEVVMHPMGMLGPTDPTVTTPFNPPNPQNPGQNLGISVEDVASYIALVKEDVGIQHEEEVVQAFAILAQNIHPLALGSVKRGTQQSRMLAERLLQQRLGEKIDEHELAEIVDKLTSRLYYHAHPINRKEAIEDLRLKFVTEATPAVESAMWNLYSAYEEEMALNREFAPLQEAFAKKAISLPAPPAVTSGQVVPSVPNIEHVRLDPIKAAYVESTKRTDVHTMQFDVVLKHDWEGNLEAKGNLVSSGWAAEV